MAVPTRIAPASTAASAIRPDTRHVPLAVVIRGDAAESIHAGSVAVVDRHGRLLHAAGDPAFATMTRSALKPFQAMPFVAADGVGRFGYSGAQVALLCASHSVDAKSRAELADWLVPVVTNYRGIATGRILSSVVLDNNRA
jgi:L-asparaginase II